MRKTLQEEAGELVAAWKVFRNAFLDELRPIFEPLCNILLKQINKGKHCEKCSSYMRYPGGTTKAICLYKMGRDKGLRMNGGNGEEFIVGQYSTCKEYKTAWKWINKKADKYEQL